MTYTAGPLHSQIKGNISFYLWLSIPRNIGKFQLFLWLRGKVKCALFDPWFPSELTLRSDTWNLVKAPTSSTSLFNTSTCVLIKLSAWLVISDMERIKRSKMFPIKMSVVLCWPTVSLVSSWTPWCLLCDVDCGSVLSAGVSCTWILLHLH